MSFYRRPITAAIEAVLSSVLSTGLVRAPKNAGWDGDPNVAGSTFVPYFVLTPMTASIASGPESDPQADRRIPYAVASYGADPIQVEWAADRARAALDAMRGSILESEDANYRVNQIRTDVIGALGEVAVQEPPFFGQVDQYVFDLGKRRS